MAEESLKSYSNKQIAGNIHLDAIIQKLSNVKKREMSFLNHIPKIILKD